MGPKVLDWDGALLCSLQDLSHLWAPVFLCVECSRNLCPDQRNQGTVDVCWDQEGADLGKQKDGGIAPLPRSWFCSPWAPSPPEC